MATTATAKRRVKRTEKQVIDLMKTTQGDRSLRDFAGEIGVTPAYISDIYNGRRSPGAKILKYFKGGKTRRTIVEYVFFK
jgi:transcriptional regulator with XRE-family HTH domain